MDVKCFEKGDLACFNGVYFRRDKSTGYYLSSRKIDGKRRRLHEFVYEAEKGDVPSGFCVHHVDGDKSNNNVSNLIAISRSEHSRIHALEEGRREQARENVVKCAMPKAKEWHKSDEGRKWHSEHGKRVFENLEYNVYTCGNCGCEFKSKKRYGENQNRFCSDKCRAAYRRKSGVDDVVKKCESCGGEYVASKYKQTKYCKECASKKRREGWK